MNNVANIHDINRATLLYYQSLIISRK